MTTLRDLMTRPTPDLTIPTYIPNPNGTGYIPNPESEYTAYDTELSDAMIWTATLLARTSGYHSDSTIDSHNAMIATIGNLHRLIYRDDLTMTEQEALDRFLDDEYAAQDLEMTINHNCSLTEPMPELPAFFTRFNLDYDTVWGDN